LGSASQIGPGSDTVEEISSLSYADVVAHEDRDSLVVVRPEAVEALSVLDLDRVLGQFGLDEKWGCGCKTSSGSDTMLLLLPIDRRFDFGSRARTTSEGSFAAEVTTPSTGVRLGLIMESMLDKLDARGMPSFWDLCSMSS